MPCQRVLPSTFVLFRREVTVSAAPRKGDGMDRRRQPTG